MIDETLFNKMRAKVLAEETADTGIGTLQEKSVHKILKLYYEPNENFHEVKFMGSVADVFNNEGIIEVQTGSLKLLTHKFAKFLPEEKVTLVHPITKNKTVKTISCESGEIISVRKSPRHEDIYSSGFELFKIRQFLLDENFTLKLLLLDCDEYRKVKIEGKSKRRTKTEKIETVPNKILKEYVFKTKEDYLAFLPETLGETFTVKEFEKAISSRSRYDYYCLRLLVEMGLLKREKKSTTYYYSRVKQ